MQGRKSAIVFLLLLGALLASGHDAARGMGVAMASDSSLGESDRSAEPVAGPLCTSFCIDNGG